MSSIAFIGLGVMGLPMAANLQRGGHDVIGVVRPGRTHDRAAEAGLPIADDLSQAVRGAEFVVTMLPDTPDVQSAFSAMAPELSEGSLVIDMSTIDPVATRQLRDETLPQGIGMLDAPVSGGEAGAVEGALSIMVGGSEQDFARATPLFDCMGTTIVHVGPVGAGQVVKAANQLIVAGNIQMVAEAVVFLRAQGADLPSALDVIAGGLAGSAVLNRKRNAFLEERFEPGFRLALHAKDLGIVQNSAAAAGLALPLTASVTQLVRALVARGDGHLDHSALLKLTQELNGG